MLPEHYKELIHLCVENEDRGKRLDVFLSDKIEKITRSIVKDWIKNKFVSLENDPLDLKPSFKISVGQKFKVFIPYPVEAIPQSKKMNLNVLFEDEHLIVINKPAGLVVHPGAGHFDDTLVNGLLYHCKDLSGIGGVLRPGIVHRLDKDTSGVMVVAKSDYVHHQLSLQFSKKQEEGGILRDYIGFCFGKPMKKDGEIITNIIRHSKQREKMTVCHADYGRYAKTIYKSEKIFNGIVNKNIYHISRIKFTLYTGRTHQIRVHASHIKCPLIGDQVYGYQRLSALKKVWSDDIFSLKRQALHAQKLGFKHPMSEEYLIFDTELPDDLQKLDKALSAI